MPPGTTDKIVYPIIVSETKKRGFKKDEILLSYSYERIMPGYNYFDSIVNNPRVYSGINQLSKNKCKSFLEKIINVKKFPLYPLKNNTDCEFSKILENTYRATNIAFIDEWTKFSKIAKVDFYNILKAIKKRDTHNNIMRPGIGVGGYCLSKDPNFAITSVKKIFNKNIKFPFVNLTMKTNKNMPNTSFEFIKDKMGKINNKKFLILGIAYKDGVGDYRNSPSFDLIKHLTQANVQVSFEDPFYKKTKKMKLKINYVKNFKFHNFDAVVFCTSHKKYKNIPLSKFNRKTNFFDLNNMINEKKKYHLIKED